MGATMQLQQIELQQFRCFEQFTLSLDPKVTLLFGWNGVGKTTLVDALSIGLGVFPGLSGGTDLQTSDLRLVTQAAGGIWNREQARATSVTLTDTAGHTWTRSRKRGESTSKWDQAAISLTAEVNEQADSKEPLPVVAIYRAFRAWKDDPFANSPDEGPLVGYDGAQNAGASLAALRSWWSHHDHRREKGEDVPVLQAVETAVARAIQSKILPLYVPKESDIFVELPDQGRFALRELSDGYRGVVALVADLARRIAQLHPSPGPDLLENATGVVVIDEVDLHLHPGWQRRVVPDLRRAFPGLQFILTTHSPQVLASVANHEVRHLTTEGLSKQRLFVEHRDTNAILREVMDTPARPNEGQRDLQALYDAIDQEDFAQARQHLAALKARWGEDDPELVRAETFLDLAG